MHISDISEFIALSETGNFAETAVKLFTTQSSLSKHIMRMEDELGVVLFDRTSRRVQLSKCGEIFLPYAKSIAQQEQLYIDALTNYSTTFGNTITLGSVNNITAYNISEVIVNFQKQFPNYTINIVNGNPYDVYHNLINGKVDIAFLRYTEHTDISDFSIIPFAEDEMVMVCSKHHPFAERNVISFSELKREKFLLYNPGSLMYDVVMQACKYSGFRPNVILNVSRTENLLELTQQNLGISFFMELHVNKYISEDSNLRIVRLVPSIKSHIDLCYKRTKKLSPAAKTFLRYTAEWKQANQI